MRTTKTLMSEDEDEAPSRRDAFTGERGWFGEEVWGVSARHRNATADPARLSRFGLPQLATEQDLAAWLGISLSRLRWYTHDRPADTIWHYVRYTVPKRTGGERVILAPKRELKALQRRVLTGLLASVPVAPSAHGFVPGRSILTNARAHVGRQVVLKLDLKDFFPSVTYPRVRGLFVALGYSFAVSSALALLCTEYERIPTEFNGATRFVSVGPRHLVQGAPTSPRLANLVAWRLDRRLGGLAAKRGYTYTRYADDLVFSSDAPEAVHALRQVVQRIVAEEQFVVNKAKTRVSRRSARQIVTGLVVNDGVSTPRQLRRRMRAILHNAQATGLDHPEPRAAPWLPRLPPGADRLRSLRESSSRDQAQHGPSRHPRQSGIANLNRCADVQRAKPISPICNAQWGDPALPPRASTS